MAPFATVGNKADLNILIGESESSSLYRMIYDPDSSSPWEVSASSSDVKAKGQSAEQLATAVGDHSTTASIASAFKPLTHWPLLKAGMGQSMAGNDYHTVAVASPVVTTQTTTQTVTGADFSGLDTDDLVVIVDGDTNYRYSAAVSSANATDLVILTSTTTTSDAATDTLPASPGGAFTVFRSQARSSSMTGSASELQTYTEFSLASLEQNAASDGKITKTTLDASGDCMKIMVDLQGIGMPELTDDGVQIGSGTVVDIPGGDGVLQLRTSHWGGFCLFGDTTIERGHVKSLKITQTKDAAVEYGKDPYPTDVRTPYANFQIEMEFLPTRTVQTLFADLSDGTGEVEPTRGPFSFAFDNGDQILKVYAPEGVLVDFKGKIGHGYTMTVDAIRDRAAETALNLSVWDATITS